MKIDKKIFGELKNGKSVYLYTLHNKNGMSVSITNYGGIITKIKTEDNNGKFDDVTLGYDNLQDYIENSPYFGAIIGRFANRICCGSFTLDGIDYHLEKNDGPNHLHSGKVGFDKVVWDVKTFENDDEVGLILSYLSKDGENNYPGNLSAEVKYTITNNEEIIMDYTATTDKSTPCNLTNHAYFNLKDGGRSDIFDHKLQINANSFTPINKSTIPTGEILPLKDTPFDFTSFTKIGKSIEKDDEQLVNGFGYDHNFVLNNSDGKLRQAAKVIEETTGRVLEVLTTEPGMQFYSGNNLDGSFVGKEGIIYNKRNGFCLETQHFPDSPNKPNFPSTILRPGEVFKSTTIYKFSVMK